MANIEALKFCFNLDTEDLESFAEATHLETKPSKCSIKTFKLHRGDYIGILDALKIDRLKLLKYLTENQNYVELKWLNFFLNSSFEDFILLDINVETAFKQNCTNTKNNNKFNASYGHNFKMLLKAADRKYISTIIQYLEKCFDRRNLFKSFVYQLMELIPNSNNFDFNIEMFINYSNFYYGKFENLVTIIKDTVITKPPTLIGLYGDNIQKDKTIINDKIDQLISIYIGIYHIQSLTNVTNAEREEEERQPEIFHTTERQNQATENLTSTLQQIKKDISYRNLSEIKTQISTLKNNISVLRNLFFDISKPLFTDSFQAENYANFHIFPLSKLVYINLKEIIFIFQNYLISYSNLWMFRFNNITVNEKIDNEKIGIIFTKNNFATFEETFLNTKSNIYFMFDENLDNYSNPEPLILINEKAKMFGCIFSDLDTVEKCEYTVTNEMVLEKCKCESAAYRHWLCLTCSTLLQKYGTNHVLCKCGKQEDSKLERFCYSQKLNFKVGEKMIRCNEQVMQQEIEEDVEGEDNIGIIEEEIEVVEVEILERTKDLSTETLCYDFDNNESESTSHANKVSQLSGRQEVVAADEIIVKTSSPKTVPTDAPHKQISNRIYDNPPDLSSESNKTKSPPEYQDISSPAISDEEEETYEKITILETSVASSNPKATPADDHSNQGSNHIYDIPPDLAIEKPHSDPSLSSNKSSTSNSVKSSLKDSSKSEKNSLNVQKKQHNLLIVGEIGAGKSTLINSIPHYLKYKTFKDALKADKIDCLIPMQFTISTEKFEEEICIKAKNDDDTNEKFDEGFGSPTTQRPKCYTVDLDDETQICFIDTPGFGDDTDQNLHNLKLIQHQIEALDEVYGICFIIPSNTQKLSTKIQNFMKIVLSIFTENESTTELPYIFFIFTNSNSTNFKIENSKATIQKFVKNYEKTDNIEIPLTDENLYCIDNEAFLKLLGIKNGKINFSRNEMKKFEYYWDTSGAEIYRFFSTFDVDDESFV